MKPKFNTWYVQWYEDKEFEDGTRGDYPEFAIFWPIQSGSKWIAFTQTHYKKNSTWYYSDSDFNLEPKERLATKEDLSRGEKYVDLNKDQAKRETIKSIVDKERWEDDE